MALSDLLRVCSKNIPGVKPTIFLIDANKIKAVTVNSTGYVSKISIDSSTAKQHFSKIEGDLDSVQFTSDGTFKTSGGYNQGLLLGVSKPRLEVSKFVDELRDSISCGVVAAYWDNNGNGWLYGANSASKEGLERPINEMDVKLDTGKLITDEDAQRVEITLKRLGGYLPVPLDPTMTMVSFTTEATGINPISE